MNKGTLYGIGFFTALMSFVTIYSGISGQSMMDILTLKGTSGGTADPGGGDVSTAPAYGDTPAGQNLQVPGDLGKMPAAGTRRFDGVPVATWIVTVLQWARNHGEWTGKVTSGWRDPSEVVTPSPGLPVAPQGQSNHGKTAWPGGAVDVSDPDGLEAALKHYPKFPTLVRGTAIGDPIHFSARGN